MLCLFYIIVILHAFPCLKYLIKHCNLLSYQERVMYSINRRPLLGGASDSEFEDDLETEVDDSNIPIPDEKPFLKPYEPHDKYVLFSQF